MGAVTNISLKQLRCFLAIAECGSFTGASARLFLTQSALTAAVQQLEDAVGLKLFDRTTRSVQLTREGEAFRPRAERILNDFDGAINDLRAISQSRSGEIRVVAAHSIIELFLAEAMSQFQDVYPGIHFTLREHGAERAEELVLKGEVDFGLTEQFKGYADLDYRPLFHDQFVVVASPGLIGCAQGVRWEALPASGFVSFTTDTGIGAYLAAKAPELLRRHIASDQVSSTMALFSGAASADWPAPGPGGGAAAGARALAPHRPHLAQAACAFPHVRQIAANAAARHRNESPPAGGHFGPPHLVSLRAGDLGCASNQLGSMPNSSMIFFHFTRSLFISSGRRAAWPPTSS
jgi:DNA-binding transcriptional LysR family regulator